MPVTFTDGVYLQAGNTYTIKMTTSSQTGQVQWQLLDQGAYANGTQFYEGLWGDLAFDFFFRTYVADEQRQYATELVVSSLSGNYGDTVQLNADLTIFFYITLVRLQIHITIAIISKIKCYGAELEEKKREKKGRNIYDRKKFYKLKWKA
ncbi:hypothetical protein JCM10914A_24340 [Paenibacillus sp. JCM 10914]|uniref:hypothetical protein n=1 Tax=Paenibacillus sp. JCM 10914 TaxID=1236974 RepID=UPI00056CC6BE|nr:hypothetical protein [Paenibacillus sp. JCM 10914]